MDNSWCLMVCVPAKSAVVVELRWCPWTNISTYDSICVQRDDQFHPTTHPTTHPNTRTPSLFKALCSTMVGNLVVTVSASGKLLRNLTVLPSAVMHCCNMCELVCRPSCVRLEHDIGLKVGTSEGFFTVSCLRREERKRRTSSL